MLYYECILYYYEYIILICLYIIMIIFYLYAIHLNKLISFSLIVAMKFIYFIQFFTFNTCNRNVNF